MVTAVTAMVFLFPACCFFFFFLRRGPSEGSRGGYGLSWGVHRRGLFAGARGFEISYINIGAEKTFLPGTRRGTGVRKGFRGVPGVSRGVYGVPSSPQTGDICANFSFLAGRGYLEKYLEKCTFAPIAKSELSPARLTLSPLDPAITPGAAWRSLAKSVLSLRMPLGFGFIVRSGVIPPFPGVIAGGATP